MSTPALAIGGVALFINVTVEFVLGQLPLLMAHCKVTLVPATTPVTVLLYKVGAVMVATPLVIVHNPVPGAGLFPASVNTLLLHWLCGTPATATGGVCVSVKTTSSKEPAQLPLLTVQRNVTLLFIARPVTVLEMEVGVVMTIAA